MASESQKNNLKADNDEISLREIILKIREWWRYLLSKWIAIFLLGLIGACLGLAYAYFKKPVYTATTTFVLEDEKGSSLGGLAGLASMAGVDIGGGGGDIFQGDNILDLYKSRTMLQKTLLTSVSRNGKIFLLVDEYVAFNKLRDKWRDSPMLENLRFADESLPNSNTLPGNKRLTDSILGVIVLDIGKNYLSVAKPDNKLSTIEVDVHSKDEFFAKAFNDELVKNVNEFYINTKTRKALNNVKILQHKTDSVRSVMNGAIYSAVAVADATPNLNPTRQVQRVAPAQRAQFSAETNKAILAEMVKNLELTKISLLKDTPLIQVIDQPIYPLENDRLKISRGIALGFLLFVFLTVVFTTISRFLKTQLD